FNTDALIESPSWSPDGTRLAWAGAGGSESFVSVRVLDVASGDIDSYNGSPAIALIDGLTWSPEGDQIAVTGRSLTGLASTLWVLDISTGTFEEIVDDKRANFPVWSPEGDVIFFSGTEGFDSDVFEIWAATPDGRTVTAVTSGSDIIGSFDVAWDANRFAFSRTSGDETIYLWERSRDRYTAIGQSQDGDPDFFGHGNALAIGRISGSGSPDIVSIATDGALLETLTNDAPASAQPNVSPIDASEIDVTGISAVTTP
ncbi:MAG: PD40 domain-containing protein, partial [Myxococcales bacterium]|nr:PD40 domain-containing protein [Myxococcales bacterium]